MSTTTSRFIEHRQNALATVFLTARESVRVIVADLGGGIDLIAEIVSEDARAGMFGVVVKGTSKALPSEKDASRYLNDVLKRSKITQSFPFPIIVLAFSMKDDDGYYAWLAEPYVSPEGMPKLDAREEFVCSTRDPKRLGFDHRKSTRLASQSLLSVDRRCPAANSPSLNSRRAGAAFSLSMFRGRLERHDDVAFERRS